MEAIPQTRYERRYRRILLLVTVSAFGPYLLSRFGLRSDHVVIFGAAFLLLPRLLFKGFFFSFGSSALLSILGIQVVYTLWVSLVTLLAGYSKESSNLVLSDFQHCLQPMVLIFLVAYGSRHLGTIALKRTLRSVCLMTCFLLAANGLLAISQVFWDVSPLIEPFLRSNEIGTVDGSVSVKSKALGRLLGIINQPFESGVAYSIGFMCWVYCFGEDKQLKVSSWGLLLVMVLGGVLSVSKVFLYGGIPAGFLYWTLSRRGSLNLNLKPIAFACVICLTVAVLFAEWRGWDHFVNTVSTSDDSTRSTFSGMTGGRYGNDDIVLNDFVDWWRESALYGFGLGYRGTIDSGYLEAAIKGGLVGVLLQLLLIGVIGLWIRKSCWNGYSKERLLLRWIWILIIGTNLGMPVLIINRASIPLWLVTCLCIMIGERERSDRKVVPCVRINGGGNQIPEQLRRRLAY